MKIDSSFASLIGSRKINEDYYLEKVLNDKAVFVLADGLGGHDNGEVASKMVCEHICSRLENYVEESNYLPCAIESAQKTLIEEQKKRSVDNSMKTTVVVLYINQNTFSVAHSGDSRLYFIRNNKAVFRTLDHSVPQAMVLSGEIRDKEIRHHMDRGKLLKSMGNEWDDDLPEYEVDIELKKLKKKDSFLLCSDGFWEWITEKEMSNILKKKLPPEQTIKEMLRIVELNAAANDMDNYTAAYIRIEEL